MCGSEKVSTSYEEEGTLHNCKSLLGPQHFSQMPPDQRAQLAQQFPPEYGVNPNDPASMAQGMARASQEKPDVAQRILAHPVMLAGGVGLAALVAKHMLDSRQQ